MGANDSRCPQCWQPNCADPTHPGPDEVTEVAWCRECGEVDKCDEDRCCLSCGWDLIVFADRHSFEMAQEHATETQGVTSSLSADLAARVLALREERDKLQATLRDVLARFSEPGHPGRDCLRTGWTPVEQVATWRALVAGEAPDVG